MLEGNKLSTRLTVHIGRVGVKVVTTGNLTILKVVTFLKQDRSRSTTEDLTNIQIVNFEETLLDLDYLI